MYLIYLHIAGEEIFLSYHDSIQECKNEINNIFETSMNTYLLSVEQFDAHDAKKKYYISNKKINLHVHILKKYVDRADDINSFHIVITKEKML